MMKKTIAAVSSVAMLCAALVMPAKAEDTAVNNGWTISYLNDALQDDTHYAELTNKEAHSGNYSLHINYPDGITTARKIKLTHSAKRPFGEWDTDGVNTFRTQFYIKGVYEKWGIQLGTFDCEESGIRGTNIRLTDSKITFEEPDENGWTKAYFDFAYPYGEKTDFNLYIYGEARDLYIDDISVSYAGTTEGRKGYQLMTDGGFEPIPTATGESLSDYGWDITNGGGVDNVIPTAEIVKDENGNKMLHLKHDVTAYNDGFVMHKNIATPSGAGGIDWSAYNIYFKAKGSFMPNSIEVGNDQYDNHLKKATAVKELPDGWTQYVVKTGGQNKTGFRMKIHNYCHDLYLDDFMVVKADSDGNDTGVDHLANGTFDSPKSALSIQPDDWMCTTVNKGNTDYIVTRDTTHAYSGKNAMFIAAPASWVDQRYVEFRQNLPENFDYSKSYTLKFKAYTLNKTLGGSVMFSNANNAAISEKGLSSGTITDLGDNWYEYTIPMQAAEGGSQIRFLATGGIGSAWIDDVSLTDTDGNNYVKNGSFENYKKYVIGEFDLTDDSYESVPSPVAGENNMTISVNTIEPGYSYALYFAIYKDGSLYKAVKAEQMDSAAGEAELKATINLDSVSDGVYSAKAFLWDDEMNPYIAKGSF